MRPLVPLLLAGAGSAQRAPAPPADGNGLISVVALLRHGNRAPNVPTETVCPRVAGDQAQIVRDFGVGPGLLTPVGRRQAAAAGAFIRERYLTPPADGSGFVNQSAAPLPVPLSRDGFAHVVLEARNDERHLDSARMAGLGMLGSMPPQILIPGPPDNLLNTPPDACAAANKKHCVEWSRQYGPSEYYRPTKKAIFAVGQICGHQILPTDYPTEGSNPHPPFQDIVDLFDFRAEEMLPLPKEWEQWRMEANTISYKALSARLFGTVEQKVYWMGELPAKIVSTFKEALASADYPEKPVNLFVASREILYAAGEYFKFNFVVDGYPPGAAVPGTTVLWELRRGEDGKGEVSMLYWYGDATTSDAPPRDAKLARITVPGCAKGTSCTLKEFEDFIARRTAEVGGKTFSQLCAEVVKSGPSVSDGRAVSGGEGYSYAPVGVFLLAAAAAVLLVRQRGAGGRAPAASASAAAPAAGDYGTV